MKNNKAFTFIEIIVVLVIIAIVALIVTPIVLNIIDKVEYSANKRSIDAYGKAIELAMQSYKLEHGKFTYDINDLNIEYSGNKVECGNVVLNENGSIFITKCEIDGKYIEDENTEDGYYQYGKIIHDYKIGDIVTYNNIKFYVINNSNTAIDYVTLLKAEPLTLDEVNTYGAGHVNMYDYPSRNYYQTAYNQNGYGYMAYYSSITCGYNGTSYDYSDCTTDYSQSEVKYVVDGWAADKFESSDLKEDSKGYSARLITIDELTDNLGYYKGVKSKMPSSNGDTPDWVYNSNYNYWTMSQYGDSASNVWYVYSDSYVRANSVYSYTSAVRPVVNLKKSTIE